MALDITAAFVALVMVVAGSALDSATYVPAVVCGVCLVWLLFYSLLKEVQR